jgi:hypothetical protein
MVYTKTILCLAVSRKPPVGRCVAGRQVDQNGFGGWVRPVSERPTREISEEERRFENGSQPDVLDVLQITMRQHVPERHQQENHEIDANYYWQRRRRADWDELQGAVERVNGPLWVNGVSTHNGITIRWKRHNSPNSIGHFTSFDRRICVSSSQSTAQLLAIQDAAFVPTSRCQGTITAWLLLTHLSKSDISTTLASIRSKKR